MTTAPHIPATVLDGVIGDACAAAPQECCGLLVGRGDRVLEALALRNVSGRLDRFEADPIGLLRAESDLAARGLAVLAHYHSHTAGPPHASRVDVEQRVWPDLPPLFHLIVSPGGDWVLYRVGPERWAPVAQGQRTGNGRGAGSARPRPPAGRPDQ